MVRVKAIPRWAVVRPVRCVVFIYKNPIHYSIWHFREYFNCDEEARRCKQYKDHVHATPEEFSPTSTTKKTANCGHNSEPATTIKLGRSADRH